MKTNHTPGKRYGELFCGAGGMSLGAINAGLQPVFALDNNTDSIKTYSRNIGSHAVCADIHHYDLDRVPAHDILGFGFPCNDYSLVGKQRGLAGTYGPLYRYAVAVLHRQQPLAFVAENVDGLTSANGGEALPIIAGEMAAAGYDCVTHRFRLEQYGVPQKRCRILIVGFRCDLDLRFRVPLPTTPQPITARQALANIPVWAANQERVRHSATVTERPQRIPPGGNAWTSDLPEHLRLKCRLQMGNHYARLHPDRPAPTITASGGGGTHGYHWSEPRTLTNRERARLQTFPDEFVFLGNSESVRRQIGMAVPPLAAQLVFRAVCATLRGETYPSVLPNLQFPGRSLPTSPEVRSEAVVSETHARVSDHAPRVPATPIVDRKGYEHN